MVHESHRNVSDRHADRLAATKPKDARNQPVAGVSWSRRAVLAALGGIAAQQAAAAAPAVPATAPSAGASASAAARSRNADDYVQVRGQALWLHGRPFFVKGINYFGSWRDQETIKELKTGFEQANIWGMFHHWNQQAVESDLRFIRSQLNATVIRIGTPSAGEFAPLVQYHQYEPWYNADGSIADSYLGKLAHLVDAAYANGIRVQFCLLWNISGEIAKTPDGFWPKGKEETKYANQVRSIASAFSDHPGVLGYSIGNEVLIRWPINGTHRSWYEGVAAGFIQRRMQDLRAAAPRQLVTCDEGAAPASPQWFAPGGLFATLPQVVTSKGYQSGRLADWVDYIGLHFYGEELKGTEAGNQISRIARNAEHQLGICADAARSVGKPLVLSEFGIDAAPRQPEPASYAPARDRFYTTVIPAAERLGIQGVLAWAALPELLLQPGRHAESELRRGDQSVPEVDIDTRNGGGRRVLYYQPFFNLFTWRGRDSSPAPTAAAQALAAAWGTHMNR